MLARSKHISVPLIMQQFVSASINGVSNVCGTLLTDLQPKDPATAQASSNIVRHALSTSGLAVIQLMISRIGAGWTFSLCGYVFLDGADDAGRGLVGPHWRSARVERRVSDSRLRFSSLGSTPRYSVNLTHETM